MDSKVGTVSKVRVFCLALVLGLMTLPVFCAEVGIEGRLLTLDGDTFDMWGIRTGSASQTQSLTDHLIAQLDDYRAHGVNTVSVYFQGTSGMYSDPFTPDGAGIDAGHLQRMLEIVEACAAREMVVIVGIFYQRSDDPQIEDWDAAKRAVRTVTEALKGRGNVIINIANEQNSSRYRSLPWARVNNVEDILDLCRIAKEVDPQRIVGAGGYDHDKNEQIGVSDAVDVLLFDTLGPQDSGELFERFVSAGVDKPIINVETFGGWTGQFMPQGVFPEEARREYLSEVDAAARHPGLYLHFHNNPWCQPSAEGDRIRYDLGGQGTTDDPGIRWYFEYVREKRTQAANG